MRHRRPRRQRLPSLGAVLTLYGTVLPAPPDAPITINPSVDSSPSTDVTEFFGDRHTALLGGTGGCTSSSRGRHHRKRTRLLPPLPQRILLLIFLNPRLFNCLSSRYLPPRRQRHPPALNPMSASLSLGTEALMAHPQDTIDLHSRQLQDMQRMHKALMRSLCDELDAARSAATAPLHHQQQIDIMRQHYENILRSLQPLNHHTSLPLCSTK